jgi:alkylation response protein AidB-like acyl-CoA dehydrogenase
VVDMVRSADTDAVVEAVREFAEKNIRSAGCGEPATIAAGLHAMGIASPVPEVLGGQGLLSPLALALVAEELARADAGIAFDIVSGAHAATFVARCGTDAQRRQVAAAIERNPVGRGTVLLYEGFGRGPLELHTTWPENSPAQRVNGRKTAVARAAIACFGVVIGNVAGRLTAALVGEEGLRAGRVVRDDHESGILGLRAARTGVVEFDGPVIGASQLTGGDTLELARGVASFRLSVAAIAVGVAAEAIDYAARYAANRSAFGRSIAAFQGVAFPLADVSMAVEAARLGVWNAIHMLPDLDETTLAAATADAVNRAMNAAGKATLAGINSLGGHGYLEDHPVERYYRDATTLTAVDFDPLDEPWAVAAL